MADVGRDELVARFDPVRLLDAGVYPEIWDRVEELDELRDTTVDIALEVIVLYRESAAAGRAIVMAIT